MLYLSEEYLQDQLNSLADTTQIIFIHPQCHQQNRVVHFLINQEHTVYIRFEGLHLTHDDLQSQLSLRLAESSSDKIDMIIIDECDRADPVEFNRFLTLLADEHKDKRIVVASRVVAVDLLEDEQFRKRCQFIPVNEALMLYDYAQRDKDKTLIEIRAFGSGHVHVNGRPIGSWDGILPRRLFFYFADRGMITRSDIFDTFWHDLPKREATNVFHVTKRKITDLIGKSFTKFTSGFYRISPEIELSYDVIQFSEFVQNSMIQSDNSAIDLLVNAIKLYRSPYLSSENDLDTLWIMKRREELHEMYGEALSILAEYEMGQGHEDQALGHYLASLKILNHREGLVERVMQIYQARKEYQDALDLYDWIDGNLDSDYGIHPNGDLQKLADEIKQALDNEN